MEKKNNKKVVNIVVTVIQVVMIIVCLVASIAIIQNPSGYRENAKDCNTSVMVVQSDSMSPTFEKDSIIFGKKVSSAKSNEGFLDLGTVVTFAVNTYAGYYLNTHRIVGYAYSVPVSDTSYAQGIVYYKKGTLENYNDFTAMKESNWTFRGYVTRGDKYSIEFGADVKNGDYTVYNADGTVKYGCDDVTVLINDDILAVWQGGKIEGVGKVIKFLQTPLYFALCILVPLVLLFVYNIVLVVRMIIADKSEKAKKQALEELSKQGSIDEEEIKRKAIEEYLARQAQEYKPEEEENTEE